MEEIYKKDESLRKEIELKVIAKEDIESFYEKHDLNQNNTDD